MKETRNEDDAMRKNMRQNTEEKDCSKIKDPISSSKKLTTDNFEFVWAKKKTDTEMKSKTRKEEGRKEE